MPEVGDRVVVIHKVVREAGYRTKVAVSSVNPDVDPVGACVGPNGSRIKNVITEIGNEKIDILKYDEDPHVFIKNSLLPAEVKRVVITDSERKEALAIVQDSQFSLAIGKNGLNVRLANRLCDWNIDVKTEAEVADMDLTEKDTLRAAEQLFSNAEPEYEEISSITQLPGIDAHIAELLVAAGYEDIQAFVDAVADGIHIEGVSDEDIEVVNKIINEVVEFEDEEEDNSDTVESENTNNEEEAEFVCPECGAPIEFGMERCPKCGIGLAFE